LVTPRPPGHPAPPAPLAESTLSDGEQDAEEELSTLRDERERLLREIADLRARPVSVLAGQTSSREMLGLREVINRKDKEILDLKDSLDAKDRETLNTRDRLRESDRARREF